MTDNHDSGYKTLFTHPRMVRDLLAGYVDGAWLAQADFTTLAGVPADYVAQRPGMPSRQGDKVWKLRVRNRWLYVYVLLEFQSRPERYMAVRMMVYQGLLYQDLIARREMRHPGILPVMLPIVLYNGSQAWHAPRCVEQLIAPAPSGLEEYLPRCRYRLIDINALKDEQHPAGPNLASALFRIEVGRTLGEVRQALVTLIEWLDDDGDDSMRHAFAVWIRRRFHGRIPDEILESVVDLEDIRAMLEENISIWFEEYKRKGLAEGRREGRLQGMQRGMQRGMQKGRHDAMAEVLQRLLARRFGPLPATVVARISAAGEGELARWTERILDAPALERVFDDEA